MGALAAAGCAWRYGGKYGRGWLGAVVARQAAGRKGRCASTGGYRTLQFKLVYDKNLYIGTTNNISAAVQ